jgi:hypothetical protein
MADVLRKAGLNVVEEEGWKDRGNGDMGDVVGVMDHHTADGPPSSGNFPSLDVCMNGRPDLDGPLCHLGLGRDGTYYCIAAGKANHAGSGSWEPLGLHDNGNTKTIGIEAENMGTGEEPWEPPIMNAYRVGVAALLEHMGFDETHVIGHLEYAPDRKIDPNFDDPYDMNAFRADVANILYPKAVIDREAFFDAVRKSIFQGSIPESAVITINHFFDEWEKRGHRDLRWLAYMLSTVRGECGLPFKSVREIGRGKGKKYGHPDPKTGHVYYGRGYVQLTWAKNYQTMGKLIKEKLYENPDLALEPPIATKVLFEGMTKGESGIGDFTHKSLEDYFSKTKEDWYNARRIINGTDKADKFAKWGQTFHAALSTKQPEA